MSERRRMGIEEALRWAYRSELPRDEAATVGLAVRAPNGFGCAWNSIAQVGELLTMIDAPSNRWGLVPDLTAMRGPDPDAVAIGLAVEALDTLELGMPDDWSPIADLGDLGELGRRLVATSLDRSEVALRATPRRLVVKYALLGGAPCWEADVPAVKLVGGKKRASWFRQITMTDAHGEEHAMEVDGYDYGAHRPYADAYRKHYLDPDPTEAVVERARYEVWHAALGVLVEDLQGRLTRITLVPTPRPARPWEVEPEALARTLPSRLPSVVVPPPAVHRAGPRAKRKREPVRQVYP